MYEIAGYLARERAGTRITPGTTRGKHKETTARARATTTRRNAQYTTVKPQAGLVYTALCVGCG